MVCALAFVLWLSTVSQPNVMAQRDYRYQSNSNNPVDTTAENSKDIIRLQETLHMYQQNYVELSSTLKDIRADSKDLHAAIDQIKGGVYVFVPILGVLNLLGLIANRGRRTP